MASRISTRRAARRRRPDRARMVAEWVLPLALVLAPAPTLGARTAAAVPLFTIFGGVSGR